MTSDQPAPTLPDVQQQVDAWIRSVGVRYFNELTNVAILAEEVGEVARIAARRYGEQSFRPGKEAEADWGGELADVLFVLVCLANQTGVDLNAEFARAMAKRSQRDGNRHHDNPKLQSK